MSALFGPRIIHEALNGLGGGLIPVHAILQLESVWNVQVQSILSGHESVDNKFDCTSAFSEEANQDEKVRTKIGEMLKHLTISIQYLMNESLQ